MPRRNAKGITANQQLDLYGSAMQGDMVMVIDPETVAPAPTSAAWTRDIDIKIQTFTYL